MNTELTTTPHPNFCDKEGRAYLVRCPECEKENYALAVASGICYACGYNLNEHKTIKPINHE